MAIVKIENIPYLKFLVLLLGFQFFFCLKLYSGTSKKELISKKELKTNRIKFFYKKNDVLKDSLILENLNFAVDSLTKVNDSLWYYIYSVKGGSDIKIRKQMIISIFKDRIHLPFVGYFMFQQNYKDLYSVNSGIGVNKTNNGFYLNSAYLLAKNFFLKDTAINEYFYEGTLPDNNKGKIYKYKLKYDKKNNVYYNKIESLNGTYSIITFGKKIKKQLKGNYILLKYYATQWIYYENSWYELNRKNYSLIKFE